MLHFCFSLLFAASASADYVTGYQAPAAAAQAPPPTSITALSEPTLDAAFSSQDAYYATAMPSFGTGTFGITPRRTIPGNELHLLRRHRALFRPQY